MIIIAGFVTLALFCGLSAIVFLSAKDLSFLHSGLFLGAWISLVLIIIAIVFGYTLGIASDSQGGRYDILSKATIQVFILIGISHFNSR